MSKAAKINKAIDWITYAAGAYFVGTAIAGAIKKHREKKGAEGIGRMGYQDIRNLSQNICDAVQDYLDYPDGYVRPVIHVYLDRDYMEYVAKLDDSISGDGVYDIDELIRDGEPDYDRANDIANEFIFLD